MWIRKAKMTPTQTKRRNQMIFKDHESKKYTSMELAIKYQMTPARVYQIINEIKLKDAQRLID